MIKTKGGEAYCISTDVTQAPSVEALMAEVVTTYGRLDCAFNNARHRGGRRARRRLEGGDVDRVLNINLKGVWLCTKYEIPADAHPREWSDCERGLYHGISCFPRGASVRGE